MTAAFFVNCGFWRQRLRLFCLTAAFDVNDCGFFRLTAAFDVNDCGLFRLTAAFEINYCGFLSFNCGFWRHPAGSEVTIPVLFGFLTTRKYLKGNKGLQTVYLKQKSNHMGFRKCSLLSAVLCSLPNFMDKKYTSFSSLDCKRGSDVILGN